MAVVQSFPILRLPLVPFNEVFNFMCILDQMWFSKISKRTKRLVKERQKFDLKIRYLTSLPFYQIECIDQKGREVLNIDISIENCDNNDCVLRKVDDIIVPMHIEGVNINTFWKCGLQKMASFLIDAFEIKSISVVIFSDKNKIDFKIFEIARKLESDFKTRIRSIDFTTTYLKREAFKSIMENYSDVPEVTISDPFNIEIRYLRSKNNPDRGSYCKIVYSFWFTLDDLSLLIANNCKIVELWNLKWTSQEVNLFLKKWIEGSTIENIKLSVKDVDLQIATEGLSVTPNNKELRYRNGVYGTYNGYGLMDCLEFQRNNGVKANIWSHEGNLVMQTDK